MLYALRVADGSSPSMIKFETHGFHPCFRYYVSLLVHVECLNNTFKRIVIDEGAADSVMSLSCWKGLGSPPLSKSGNMLLHLMEYRFDQTTLFLPLRSKWEGIPLQSRSRWLMRPLTIIYYWVVTRSAICKR